MYSLAIIGKDFELTISPKDIFESKLREAQFGTESRFQFERQADPEIHSTSAPAIFKILN